jgi:hypothetical protein
MARNNIDSEIRSRIESFLAEMGQLVRLTALEAVHAALTGGNGVSAPRRGPGRPRKNGTAAAAPARRGRSGKRSPEAVQKTADALLAYVKGNEGQTIEQVAKGMSTSTKELKLPVIKLIEAKSIKTKGQKRGTKYFVR